MKPRLVSHVFRTLGLLALLLVLACPMLGYDPCCECPPTALCYCETNPPDCPPPGNNNNGSGCTDKYGNPIECPSNNNGNDNENNNNDNELCYDKFGNPFLCEPDCDDCSCDAYAQLHPECGSICCDETGVPIPCDPPPCTDCCENPQFALGALDTCPPPPQPPVCLNSIFVGATTPHTSQNVTIMFTPPYKEWAFAIPQRTPEGKAIVDAGRVRWDIRFSGKHVPNSNATNNSVYVVTFQSVGQGVLRWTCTKANCTYTHTFVFVVKVPSPCGRIQDEYGNQYDTKPYIVETQHVCADGDHSTPPVCYENFRANDGQLTCCPDQTSSGEGRPEFTCEYKWKAYDLGMKVHEASSGATDYVCGFVQMQPCYRKKTCHGSCTGATGSDWIVKCTEMPGGAGTPVDAGNEYMFYDCSDMTKVN